MPMTEIEELERKIVLKRQVITAYQEEQRQLEQKTRNEHRGIMRLRSRINEIRKRIRIEQESLYELENGISARA